MYFSKTKNHNKLFLNIMNNKKSKKHIEIKVLEKPNRKYVAYAPNFKKNPNLEKEAKSLEEAIWMVYDNLQENLKK